MTSHLERRRQAEEHPSAEPACERLRQVLLACQMELELRTELFRSKLEKITVQRNRYLQFYLLAPVGYLVLDQKGLIVDANLAATILLETEWKALLGGSWN